MTLFIHLFGSIELRQDNKPLRLKGYKPFGLLAYLLITQQAHTRQHLVDLLYDGTADPRASLRWTLSQLRQTIGTEYLQTDRERIGFNFESDYWLDVDSFIKGNTDAYRGEFLEGLHVREAHQFIDWLDAQRRVLKRSYEEILAKKLATFENSGHHENVIRVADQLIQLDNLREEWHQALMRAYFLVGDRKAASTQYETCRQVLVKELGIEPSQETRALYEQIQAGTLEDPRSLAELPVQFPSYLMTDKRLDAPALPLFVARTREIERLDRTLDKALAGQTQVAFAIGGAGRGKTALLTEFSRRAQTRHPNLRVAIGRCDSFSGLGDPYLPFRDVMGMLTGEVENRLASGAITGDHARRLWAGLLPVCQVLLDQGRDLIDVLVSRRDLLDRTRAAIPPSASNLVQVRQLAQPPKATPTLAQEYVFQQLTNVLHTLAARQPLLILLDDLQWADTTSLDLLFYLGRRLGHSPLMILGAYRPNEVALGRDDGPHPLQKVMSEFKNAFGEVEVDLGQTDEREDQDFIESVLDAEPNQLKSSFRKMLYQHTKGYPLFTIELLRTMQERGDLTQDSQGRWVEGPTLNWQQLPIRVEAVIEERIGRLENDLRQVLTVASVEGEEFTAQAIARVQKMDEWRLLDQLSQTLAKKHRLVRDLGEVYVDDHILSRYRFLHVLFQRYLYNDLKTAARRLLHREIGIALENLYGEHTEEIAVQLARHFQEAHILEKAVTYLRLAGEQAAQQYANNEAIMYFNGALKLLPEQAVDERYKLLACREKVYDLQGERAYQKQDLIRLYDLAEKLNDDKKRFESRLRQANYAETVGDYQAALTAAQQAVDLAKQLNDQVAEAEGYIAWGKMLWRQGNYEAAREQLEQALVPAQAVGNRLSEAKSLYYLGNAYLYQEKHAPAKEYYQQALAIYWSFGHRQGEADSLNMIGIINYELGDLSMARDHHEKVLVIFHTLGDRRGETLILNNLGNLYCDLGDFATSRDYQEQALDLRLAIDDRWGEAMSHTNLGLVYHHLGDNQTAQTQCEQAIAIQMEIGDRSTEGYSLTYLGHALAAQGNLDAAAAVYREAMILRQDGKPASAIDDRPGLARIALAQDNSEEALAQVEEILTWLDENGSAGVEYPLQVQLICYQVLRAVNGDTDQRAAATLQTAHQALMKQANDISDPGLRQSLLENIPAHRDILQAWAALK